jgi:tRNA pseudouridine38-40 synthase
MYKYKLTVAYEGTAYSGWQVQHNAASIQSIIENAFHTILQVPIALHGSGRTDAGVHALAQVAHFTAPFSLDSAKTLLSLNCLLPPDIRVTALDEVPPTFHARYSASAKIYHYHLHLDRVIDPFTRHYAYHVPHRVDRECLKAAALHLTGTHDFTSFANEAHLGSASHDAVRTLSRLDVCEEQGGIRLEFEGDGFLYKMVRNITGTLLDICAGKIAAHTLPAIREAKDRRQAGRAAPSHGLFLVEVKYPTESFSM